MRDREVAAAAAPGLRISRDDDRDEQQRRAPVLLGVIALSPAEKTQREIKVIDARLIQHRFRFTADVVRARVEVSFIMAAENLSLLQRAFCVGASNVLGLCTRPLLFAPNSLHEVFDAELEAQLFLSLSELSIQFADLWKGDFDARLLRRTKADQLVPIADVDQPLA